MFEMTVKSWEEKGELKYVNLHLHFKYSLSL